MWKKLLIVCLLELPSSTFVNARPLNFMKNWIQRESGAAEEAREFEKSVLWTQLPKRTKQVLWLSAKDWEAKEAELQRLHLTDKGEWQSDGTILQVKIGRKGVALGLGLHQFQARHEKDLWKEEGDAKTPLGIFELPYAFGQTELAEIPHFTKMPYEKMTEHHAGVDDSNSSYYNQVVDARKVKKDWVGAEKMVLKDGTYDWGIFVSHNPKGSAQKGSCIFIHLKKANGDSTSGCVAMSKTEMENLLRWLDPQKSPVLLVSLDSP